MPELPDALWELIIDFFELSHTIRAAKELRKIARVSRIFGYRARIHEDNNTALSFWTLPSDYFKLPEESDDSDIDSMLSWWQWAEDDEWAEMMVLMVLMNIIIIICDGCRHAPPATPRCQVTCGHHDNGE